MWKNEEIVFVYLKDRFLWSKIRKFFNSQQTS